MDKLKAISILRDMATDCCRTYASAFTTRAAMLEYERIGALETAITELQRAIDREESALRKAAIEHYEYGISHGCLKEPVTSYAKLAVEALREKESKNEVDGK